MTKNATRNAHLQEILLDRRRELQDEVQRRIHENRTDRPNDVHDELERTDAGLSDDVEFALIQMKAETMSRIDEALKRLETGEYGCCFGCGVEISETRLRALPFAVRCRNCEERREQGQAQTRRLAQQQASLSLLPPR
jgi:DnaK suppressor protein